MENRIGPLHFVRKNDTEFEVISKDRVVALLTESQMLKCLRTREKENHENR